MQKKLERWFTPWVKMLPAGGKGTSSLRCPLGAMCTYAHNIHEMNGVIKENRTTVGCSVLVAPSYRLGQENHAGTRQIPILELKKTIKKNSKSLGLEFSGAVFA